MLMSWADLNWQICSQKQPTLVYRPLGHSGQSGGSRGGGRRGGVRAGRGHMIEPDPIYKEGDDSGVEESWLGTDWVLSDDDSRTPRCTSDAGTGPSHTTSHEDIV